MSEPQAPRKSNGGKGKYEVLTEAEFNHKVLGGTHFNGFIVFPNQTYGFAVPLQGHDTIRTGMNSGFVIPKQNHFVFKPLQEDSPLERITAMIKPKTPPERNPKNYENQRGTFTGVIGLIPNTFTIKSIFVETGGKKEFDKNFMKFMKGQYVATDSIVGLSSIAGYVSDSESVDKANETNQWVNKYGVFYADNIKDAIYDAEYTNFILGCMIYGIGPENIVFPTNGTISSTLKDAGIVHDALDVFYQKNKGKLNDFTGISQEFSGNGHNLPSIKNNGLFHPETFLGSANVRIQQKNSTQLLVEVFNITSLTSGDLFKHLEFFYSYPMSIVRHQLSDEYEKMMYGNVSQTYSFTIDIDFSRLGIDRKTIQLPNRELNDF